MWKGFLATSAGMIDQNLDGFSLIAAVQTAADSRFDSAGEPANFTRADLYQLHQQFMARVNSSIEGWADRMYESGDEKLIVVPRCGSRTLTGFCHPVGAE